MRAMPRTRWVEFSAGWLDWSQQNLLAAVRATDPSVLRSRPAPTAPSIAFHAWHMARWADKNQSAMPAWLAGRPDDEFAPEIWFKDDVIGRWGLRDIEAGDFGGTGAGLDDDASAALPLPEASELIAYVEAAFAAFLARVEAIDDDALLDLEITDLYGDESTIGDAIASATSHTDRHLGMIEALRGVLGDHGTVTI
jgi:hypothetical protein